MLFTMFTALSTPFPPYLFISPSLNSRTSVLPVDAPDGTEAVPVVPSRSSTVVSIVGFPFESSISLADMF